MLDYTDFEALAAIVFLIFLSFKNSNYLEIAFTTRLRFDPRSFDISTRNADH
jgi:hypothetical protein